MKAGMYQARNELGSSKVYCLSMRSHILIGLCPSLEFACRPLGEKDGFIASTYTDIAPGDWAKTLAVASHGKYWFERMSPKGIHLDNHPNSTAQSKLSGPVVKCTEDCRIKLLVKVLIGPFK